MTSVISRRTVLASAAGLALAGCSSAVNIPKVTTSPTGTVREQLDAVIKTIVGDNQRIGVALKALDTGATFDANGGYANQLASAAKPMIVAMAQRKAAKEGTPLGAAQLEQAGKAIRNSDNDAADALFEWAGRRPAFDALAAELRLSATHSDPARDFWSWCWSTPKDQLAFLEQLVVGSPVMSQTDRAQLLGLMGQVQDDQAWGVGAPRSAEVSVQVKNGWVQFESTDKLWAVNSFGHVSGGGRDYLLTIMTRTPDFDTGRAYCTEIGTWVYNVMGSGKLT